jgi:hypothetical protein
MKNSTLIKVLDELPLKVGFMWVRMPLPRDRALLIETLNDL